MEHNILSTKLDAITKSELGIHFDEGLVWKSVEGRVGGQGRAVGKRFILAACLTLLILLLPMKSIRNEGQMQSKVVELAVVVDSPEMSITSLQEANDAPTKDAIEALAIVDVKSRGVDLGLAHISPMKSPTLNFIELPAKASSTKAHFLEEDVSKIQATLEKSKRKNQLKISVKTEIYTSSRNVDSDGERLKIRLDGKN